MGGCSVQLLFVNHNETNCKVYASLARQIEFGAPAFVLVTAFDAFGRKQLAREAGFGAFLTKPLELEALRGALIRWLPSALTMA
jgi:CheY-like chemotaxis protein